MRNGIDMEDARLGLLNRECIDDVMKRLVPVIKAHMDDADTCLAIIKDALTSINATILLNIIFSTKARVGNKDISKKMRKEEVNQFLKNHEKFFWEAFEEMEKKNGL